MVRKTLVNMRGSVLWSAVCSLLSPHLHLSSSAPGDQLLSSASRCRRRGAPAQLQNMRGPSVHTRAAAGPECSGEVERSSSHLCISLSRHNTKCQILCNIVYDLCGEMFYWTYCGVVAAMSSSPHQKMDCSYMPNLQKIFRPIRGLHCGHVTSKGGSWLVKNFHCRFGIFKQF